MMASSPPNAAHVLPPSPSSVSFPMSTSAARGYALMLCSAACNAASSLLVHASATRHSVPPSVALLLRSLTSLLLAFLSLLRLRLRPNHLNTTAPSSPSSSFPSLPQRLKALVLLRGILGAAAVHSSFSALAVLPVGTAATLSYLSPALATLLSRFVVPLIPLLTPPPSSSSSNAEAPLSTPLVLSILLNFLAVALVSLPNSSSLTPTSAHLSAHFSAGVLHALTGALCVAAIFTMQRAMATSVHYTLCIASFASSCLLLSLCLGAPFLLPSQSTHGLSLALTAGGAGYASQAFLNVALAYIPVPVAAVTRSASVPIALVAAALTMNEIPGGMEILGVFLVLASVAGITAVNERHKDKEKHIGKDSTQQQQRHVETVGEKEKEKEKEKDSDNEAPDINLHIHTATDHPDVAVTIARTPPSPAAR